MPYIKKWKNPFANTCNCMYQRTQPLLHVPLLLYSCIPLIMGDSVRGSDKVRTCGCEESVSRWSALVQVRAK